MTDKKEVNMRFKCDHDLHIHSYMSRCSGNPDQNPNSILEYGERNGFKTLCLTDHVWDETIPTDFEWYISHPYEREKTILPLPQSDKVRFLFGCETDMDKNFTIGISKKIVDEMDFFIIPTTHMHLNGFSVEGTEDGDMRAELWVRRFDAVLDSELPLEKAGIAHLTCGLIWGDRTPEVIDKIPEDEFHRLFEKAAKRGLGIELNFSAVFADSRTADIMLRPYRVAREEKCKFYLGSDRHSPERYPGQVRSNFESIIDLLDLTEDDKIPLLL